MILEKNQRRPKIVFIVLGQNKSGSVRCCNVVVLVIHVISKTLMKWYFLYF